MSNAKELTGFDIRQNLKSQIEEIQNIEALHKAVPTNTEVLKTLQNLAAYAKMVGVSQYAAAKHIGIKRSYMSEVLSGQKRVHGKPHTPSIEVLLRIAAGYIELIKLKNNEK